MILVSIKRPSFLLSGGSGMVVQYLLLECSGRQSDILWQKPFV